MFVLKLTALSAVMITALALLACGGGSSGSTAPSCEDLNKQAQACASFPPAVKASFLATCAQPRIDNDACRSCLDGKLCGNTEACDPACGK